MAEPSSAIPYLVLGGASVAATFPGLDPFSVVGAGVGAGMFSMVAYWIPNFWVRLTYFFCSWIFGYLYSVQGWLPEIISGTGPAIKAFFAAFLIVMVCTSIAEFIRTGKIPGWIDQLIKVIRGRKGEPDA